MPNIGTVWSRIVAHAGGLFHTLTGSPFRYDSADSYIKLNNTERNIPKSDFATALSHVPLRNVAEVQRLGVQGPSNLYAVLMDLRVRQDDW